MKVDMNYDAVWSAMNALEELSAKMISIRAVIDSASEYASKNDCDQAEKLCQASLDLINWYIDSWDERFQEAWNVTVSKIKHAEFDKVMESNEFFTASFYTDDEITAMCDKAQEDDIILSYSNK